MNDLPQQPLDSRNQTPLSPDKVLSPIVPIVTTPPPSKIEVMVDKIKVNGPRLDNAYTITLEVGEYEREKIAQITSIAQPANFKVSIEVEK